MLNISFAMTADAFRDRTKTVTRRFWKDSHAKKFKKGTVFMGISKDFRAGGERIHPARVTVDPYKQTLIHMNLDHFYREGGERYWPTRLQYIEAMGGMHKEPYVVEFQHFERFYIAALFSTREETRSFAKIIEDLGFECNSIWLEEGNEWDYTPEYLGTCAISDVDDIKRSDFLIALGDTGITQGGARHAELGVAIAQGIPILFVGEHEHTFHYHPLVEHFESRKELLDMLK